MPELRPFQGIRYAESDLDAIACPPYDVISPEQQQELYDKHEHNAVRLELAQTGGDPDGYAAVDELFRSWLADGTLAQDRGETLYVYRQDFSAPGGGSKHVAGVIGALTLEPFGEGVLPHERTMPGPIEDRLALMRACPVNISPIFGIYRGGGDTHDLLNSIQERDPAASATDEAGVTHRLWAVTDQDEIEGLTLPLASTPLVIADGHHRYETALAFHAENEGKPGGHGSMMCFCVDADSADLFVLPYHRIVTSPVDSDRLMAGLVELGATEIDAEGAEEALEASRADHAFVFVLETRSLLLEVDDEFVIAYAQGPNAWRALDVVALHEAVLPALDLQVLETTFSKDAGEVRSEVWSGHASFGILLRAVAPVEVVDVARSGARMPQKASHFWPKAITGLVFRPLT